MAMAILMTALPSGSVPSNINTLERHLAWAGFSLAYINPTKGVLEEPTRAEKVAQAAIFQAADNTYRLLVRACLPLNVEYMNDRTKKIWMHIDDVSGVTLPEGFTTN
jgi:hypothetical protein